MSQSNIIQYLKPEVVQSIGSFQLIAKVIVEGFLVGLHKSPFHGFSAEFSDYRQYMQGDDIKLIDWKVYGRSDRYYIKRFEEETNLNAYIILDRSKSMEFRSGSLSKFQYGKYLVSAISYLLYKQRDNFSLSVFSDHVDLITSMRHSMNHLFYVLSILDKLEPSGKTGIVESINKVAEQIKHRGLVIFISDFQGISLEETQKALLHFIHKKNELLIFHILDPHEIQFDYTGQVEFIDLETGEVIKTRPDKIRDRIQESLNLYYSALETFCLNHRIDYNRITTDQSFFKAMTAFFNKRTSML